MRARGRQRFRSEPRRVLTAVRPVVACGAVFPAGSAAVAVFVSCDCVCTLSVECLSCVSVCPFILYSLRTL